MQAYKQVRDVIEIARGFYRQLADFYRGLEDETDGTQVQALLDHLSRHERYLDTCLEQWENHCGGKINDIWLQYVPDARVFDHLADEKLNASMTVTEVVHLAMRLDEALIQFYGQLAEEAEMTEARELFENLCKLVQQEQLELEKT